MWISLSPGVESETWAISFTCFFPSTPTSPGSPPPPTPTHSTFLSPNSPHSRHHCLSWDLHLLPPGERYPCNWSSFLNRPITPCFPPLLGILCKSCPECYFLNELMIPVLPVSLRWRSIYLCANDLKLLSICIDSVPWCSFGSFSGPPLSLPIHTLLSVYFIFPTVNSLMAEPFKHQTPMART